MVELEGGIRVAQQNIVKVRRNWCCAVVKCELIWVCYVVGF